MARDFRAQFVFRKRIELLEKQDRRIGIAALLALRAQFVADFSAANQDALGGRRLRGPAPPIRNRGRRKSSIGEDASGCRSMLFGVNTISGLRQRRSACRRSK